jgi:hypothetical protein
MAGRLLMTRFRGARRGVTYVTSGNDPEALSWQFADFPFYEPMTAAERADIEAICLTDLRERRAAWRAQLLRRRLVPDLRRKRW